MDKQNTFQVWLGTADNDIREVVAEQQCVGKSVSEILKELIRRGIDKRDDQIIEMLGTIIQELKETR